MNAASGRKEDAPEPLTDFESWFGRFPPNEDRKIADYQRHAARLAWDAALSLRAPEPLTALPPLPERVEMGVVCDSTMRYTTVTGYTADQMRAYARAALEGGVSRTEPALTDALRDVKAERERQVSVEGWTAAHDDEHHTGAMARAAAAYALAGSSDGRVVGDELEPSIMSRLWPFEWARSWWKPRGRRHNLVRAGALILAEIERLDRALVATKGQ